jgi:hypothetical protein
MSTGLRPMNLGEILDRTFQIYRKRFPSLVAVGIILAALMLAFHLVDMQWVGFRSLVKPFRQPGIFMWNMVVALGFYHISSLLTGAIFAAIVKQASSAVLDEDCTLRTSLRFFAVRWSGYLWLSFLKVVTVLVLVEAAAVGLLTGMGYSMDALGMLNGDNNWAFAALILVPTVIGVYLFLRVGACLSLALPVAALEEMRGFKALRRSWTLSRESRGRLAAAWVLLAAFLTLLSWGLQLLVRWGFIYLYWHLNFRRSTHFYEAVYFVLNGAVTALGGPLYPIAVTLFYYDQRIRHEGFDIEWMMKAAGMNAPVSVEPAPFPVAVSESGEQPA